MPPPADLSIGPFREWCEAKIEECGSNLAFAARVGVHERRVRSVLLELERISTTAVDLWLTRYGEDTTIEDLYPLAGRWRYCPFCDDNVITDASHACPLCERRTNNSRTCPSCGGRKAGPSRFCIACAPHGVGGHLVPRTDVPTMCPRCGGSKTKSALACWSCYVENGSHTGRRHRKTPKALKKITPEVLDRAHELYEQGWSLRQVARMIYPDTDYANEKTCSTALYDAFASRGWKLRDRVTAVQQSNRDRAFRPVCKHVFGGGRKKGTQCVRQSIGDDGYCWKHKPERIAAGVARLRAIDDASNDRRNPDQGEDNKRAHNSPTGHSGHL